jgi:hypothetical protein
MGLLFANGPAAGKIGIFGAASILKMDDDATSLKKAAPD